MGRRLREWKESWTRRDGKRFIYEVGFLCNICATCCVFIAFVSGYWIVSWPRVYSGFKRIGLWEACFAGLVLETDPDQKSYHGCWWILAPEFWDIKGWLMPAWFIYTQIVVTLCFAAEVVGTLLIFLLYIWSGATQRGMKPSERIKKRESITLLQTAVAITFITTIMMSSTMLIFAVMFKADRRWLPNPYFNYLSWSYGLALLSSFFSIFASIAQITYVLIVRQERREPPKAMDMSGYSLTSKPDHSRADFSRADYSRSEFNASKA